MPDLTFLIAGGSRALSIPNNSLQEHSDLTVVTDTPAHSWGPGVPAQHKVVSAELGHDRGRAVAGTPWCHHKTQTRSGASGEMLIYPQQLRELPAGSEANKLLFPLP